MTGALVCACAAADPRLRDGEVAEDPPGRVLREVAPRAVEDPVPEPRVLAAAARDACRNVFARFGAVRSVGAAYKAAWGVFWIDTKMSLDTMISHWF